MQRSKSGSTSTTRACSRGVRARLAAILALVLATAVVPLGVASAQTVPPTVTSTSTTPAPSTTDTSSPSTTGTTSSSTTEPTPTSTTASIPRSTSTTVDDGPTTTQPPGSPAANNPGLVDELKAGSDELTLDELELLQKFLDAQGEVNSITDELITINQQYVASQQDLLDAISQVADAEERLQRTTDQLGRAQADLDKEQRRLQQDAVSAYVGGGRTMTQARAIISAQNVDELSKSIVYASAVAEDDKDVVEQFRALKSEVDDLRRRADQDRNDATQARDSLADRQATLDQQRTELLDARGKKQESVEEKVRLLAEVEEKKGDFFLRYSQQRSSGGSLGDKLRTLQAGQVLPSSTLAIMRQPLDKFRLTSKYGGRIHPLYGATAFHPGIDMAIPSGEPIHAAMDGVVILSEYYGGYGNCVVVEHGNGLATLYGHQTTTAVEVGDFVAMGQTIGYVGSTGNSTGPHLHWEVRVFGETTDPIPYMRPI